MKTILRGLRFAFAGMIGAVGFSSAGACAVWQQDVQIHGVTFARARITDTGLVIGYINSDRNIRGRSCHTGWVHLHPNGIPAAFMAATEISVADWKIPVGTWVQQSPEGVVRVCSFPYHIEIQGHLCRGSSAGPKGVQTAFYPSGALKQFFAPQPVRINGVPCGTNHFQPGIELHENGRLRSATLFEDYLINGRMQKRGQRVHFTADGLADIE